LRPDPDFTFRDTFIARVIGTSPLVLELLDSRPQHLDRKMSVVLDDPLQGAEHSNAEL
jgi:hypothetical protein